jgi:hypothetical protein
MTNNSQQTFAPSRLAKFFIRILPDRVRRAVILTSLAAKVEKIGVDDHEILNSINETMSLVETPNSLPFTVVVKDMIWVDTTQISGEIAALRNHADSTRRLRECAKKLVDMIPPILRYADATSMAEDFYRLFQHPIHR